MKTTSLLACLALAACGEGPVIRVMDGRAESGRYISEAAYALYARGTLAESSGDLANALRAYEWAATEDPDSPEVWTRIGAIVCRAAPAGPVPMRAEGAFDRARAIDATFGPLYRERARCLLARADPKTALDDAERALALDPNDLDTAMVRAEVLDRAGRLDEARRSLRALTLSRPASSAPWRALLDLARRTNDPALAREADDRLAVLAPAPRPSGASEPAGIDDALRARDLVEARRRALKGRIASAEVAVRAAALGIDALARQQAELVLAADPTDASARIALATAADLAGDMDALAAALRAIPRRTTPPSPLARWLFAEVLNRRVGAEAALAWLGAPDATNATNATNDPDPLLDATQKRVRAALVAR